MAAVRTAATGYIVGCNGGEVRAAPFANPCVCWRIHVCVPANAHCILANVCLYLCVGRCACHTGLRECICVYSCAWQVAADVHVLADGGNLVIVGGKSHVAYVHIRECVFGYWRMRMCICRYSAHEAAGVRLVIDGTTCLFTNEYVARCAYAFSAWTADSTCANHCVSHDDRVHLHMAFPYMPPRYASHDGVQV